jgi:hypothetical protein
VGDLNRKLRDKRGYLTVLYVSEDISCGNLSDLSVQDNFYTIENLMGKIQE